MIMTSAISTENFFINANTKIVLSDERKKILQKISHGILEKYKKDGVVNLNFICTHNSRRSHHHLVIFTAKIVSSKLKTN